ncbi:hypothetical protein D3C73_605850 [compost metagenome]
MIVFVALSNLLQVLGQLVVVQGRGALGAGVLQRQEDHAGAQVRRDQAPDLAGAFDVLTHLIDAVSRTVIGIGDHRAAVEAFFGHANPACGWGPQGFHVRPIHTVEEEQLVINLLQGVEVVGVIDRALLGLQGDAQGVAAFTKLPAILEVVFNVGVPDRDHFFERRAQMQVR